MLASVVLVYLTEAGLKKSVKAFKKEAAESLVRTCPAVV
jgi:hypothetical protein